MSSRSRRSALVIAWSALALTMAQPLLASRAEAQATSTEALETDGEARSLFEAGREAFLGGRFEAALDYFERSYQLSGRSALLFNIGNAADRLGQHQRALEAFETYLREAPTARNRGEVEARIVSLRTELELARSRDEPREDQPSNTLLEPVWLWTLGIGSGVTAIAGGVLLALGEVDRATVESAAPGSAWSTVQGAYERAALLGNVGWVLLTVGVLGSAAALTIALVPIERESSQPSVAVRLGLDGVGLAGTF